MTHCSYPEHLVEANIGDVDVASAVYGQTVGHVEHPRPKRGDPLTVLGVQHHNGVLLDDLLGHQLVAFVKGSGKKNSGIKKD